MLKTLSLFARRSVVVWGGAVLLGGAAPPMKAPQFAAWIDGTTPNEPQMQVQQIDPDTFVIRQSVQTNFEAPFLYILFGKTKALLIDTGAGGLKVRPTVDRLISEWQGKNGNVPVRLVVAHSHGHGDHQVGDEEFRDRPNTQLVGLPAQDVAKFFKIAHWPHDIGHIDLGERPLEVIPTPGHHASHIMVYDARTQLLFSGDMLYPGRIYVPANQFEAFRDSTERLVAFAATHPIRALLGAHIEMTDTAGQDYAQEASTHPHEHILPLPPSVIAQLREAAVNAPANPAIDRRADFILYPVPATPEG